MIYRSVVTHAHANVDAFIPNAEVLIKFKTLHANISKTRGMDIIRIRIRM